jgi:hypothetical protein
VTTLPVGDAGLDERERFEADGDQVGIEKEPLRANKDTAGVEEGEEDGVEQPLLLAAAAGGQEGGEEGETAQGEEIVIDSLDGGHSGKAALWRGNKTNLLNQA